MAEKTNSVDTESAQLQENAMISLSNSANISPAQLQCSHSHNHNYYNYQQYISRTDETLIINSKDNNAYLNNSTGIFNSIVQSFRPVGTLGRGNKGTVVLVISKNSSAPFALKITSKKTHNHNHHSHQKPSPPLLLHQHLHMESHKRQQRRSSAKKKNDVEREILSMLHHPFLQTLHAHCDSGKHSLLLIDFCSGGDLNVLRHKQPEKRFSETAARFYAAEVLLALDHLHKLGIIYRDLKPENILIQDNGHIKLTDFDLSLKLKPPGARSAAAALRRTLTSSSSSSSTSSFSSQLQRSHSHNLNHNHNQQQQSQPHQILTLRDLVLVKDSEKTPLRGGRHVQRSVVRPFSCFRGCIGMHRDTDSVDSSEAETWCSSSVTELWRASVENEPNAQAKMKMHKNHNTKKTKIETLKKHKVICFVGTEEYVAPEVMTGAEHTPAMDWWSYGVLLYELIYGKTPFKGSCSRETLYNIMEKEADFPGMKSSAKQLIRELLVKEPAKRPGAEAIKKHPFFHGVRWDMIPELARPPFIPAPYSISELDTMAKRKLHQLQSNNVNDRTSNSSSWIDEILRSEQSEHSSCTSSSDGELSSRSARLEYQSSTNSSAFSSSADSLSRREDNLEELSIFSNSQEWGSEYSWRR